MRTTGSHLAGRVLVHGYIGVSWTAGYAECSARGRARAPTSVARTLAAESAQRRRPGAPPPACGGGGTCRRDACGAAAAGPASRDRGGAQRGSRRRRGIRQRSGGVEALDGPDPTAILQPRARKAQERGGLDGIVVSTPQGIRIAHADPGLIGNHVIGPYEKAAHGESFTHIVTDPLGLSVYAAVPVFRPAGSAAGIVYPEITVKSVGRGRTRPVPHRSVHPKLGHPLHRPRQGHLSRTVPARRCGRTWANGRRHPGAVGRCHAVEGRSRRHRRFEQLSQSRAPACDICPWCRRMRAPTLRVREVPRARRPRTSLPPAVAVQVIPGAARLSRRVCPPERRKADR
ncbi:hypothetical protein ABZ281_06565 [Streptomyces sp. NPDC006265]|uniref:hypothetical protein n=1 Tax=Streptomyces sp. NPDC006265 TaxID=3156740 RepID=UPI0033A5173D